MSLATYFRDYCENVLPFDYSEFEKWDNRLKEITKKLNKKYYSDENIEDLEVENRYVVGSVGRGTAVSKTSDFDCIFKLPQDVFVRFDNRSNNGQSELLQEVREVVKSRYGLTDIKG
ncbi:MAG: SMODS domain-containing nucleotidyltransferase, partial [Lactococcus lactis]